MEKKKVAIGTISEEAGRNVKALFGKAKESVVVDNAGVGGLLLRPAA